MSNIAYCHSRYAEFLRKAAQGGHSKTVAIVKAAGEDGSDERLFVELMICDAKIVLGRSQEEDHYSVAYSVGSVHSEEHGNSCWMT